MNRALAIAIACIVLAGTVIAGTLVFDVASVKVCGPDSHPPYTIMGGPGTRDTGRFRASHATMRFLLERAYGVQPDQIGGPSWIKDVPASLFYDVAVTMPPDTSKKDFQQMLQNLLAERFHLVIHHETRHFPGYDLVVDKGAPKIKDVMIDDDVPDGPQTRRPRGTDGFPMLVGPATIILGVDTDDQRIKFQQRTMGDFAGTLEKLVAVAQGFQPDDPVPRVADMTGLTGNYTFSLEYSCPACAARFGKGSGDASAPGSGVPDIFKAIQQQLGLRLVKNVNVSLDVIVVDSVDKTPVEN